MRKLLGILSALLLSNAVLSANFTATKTADNEIIAVWQMDDGEYLIIDNANFRASNQAKFSKICSTGKPFKHSFFGDIQIAETPFSCVLTFDDLSADSLTISSSATVCKQPEICQAPLSRQATINAELLKTATSDGVNIMGNLFSKTSGLSGVNDGILSVDQAFKLTKPLVQSDGVLIEIDIADEHYLYRDKFKFTLSDNANLRLAKPKLPKGKIKDDPNFGKMAVVYNEVKTVLPINNQSNKSQTVDLTVHYQGCAEQGICYPPTKKIFSLEIPALMAINANYVDNGSSTNLSKNVAFNLNNQDNDIINSLKSGNLWLIIMAFFISGLLLAFTPCVFPMIPILSGIIAGQGEITTRKSFLLSVVYVLSMASIYALIGVLSGLVGESIQAWFQKPWVLLSFGMIISTMALSMFGLFELQMPSFIQNKASNVSNQQKSGSLIGVSVMGMLSALIVGACSTPVLAVAIGYIGKTGDPILGSVALFMMSLGMGVPLLLIGTSAGKWLPKKGMWMDTVKHTFGVLMLAVALYIIEPAIPSVVSLGLWAILLIATGVFMGAFEAGKSGLAQLGKSLGLALFAYGILMLIGVGTGKGTLLSPLKGISGGGSVAETHENLTFKRIKGVAELDAELADAQTKGQFVMMDFYADWCKACIELEEFTFSDKSVQKALKNVKLLQADVTLNDETDKQLLKRFGINGPPAILFFDKSSNEKIDYRLNGFFGPEDFIQQINVVFAL